MAFGLKHILSWFFMAAGLMACSLVDEDLRGCEQDCALDYELQLVTNMTTELQTQLSLAADVALSTALETRMRSIFTDFAHDVDLSFYDVQGDSLRLHHESHIMDASESSYTLYIPVRKYMHLAVANLADNRMVELVQGEKCHGAFFRQPDSDTLDCHKTGLFSARLLMDVKEGIDQQFDVSLYMVNCASSLVLDTLGSGIKDVRVFMSGFATGFNLADSTYRFDTSPVIRPEKINAEGDPSAPLCFTSVSFPSRDLPDSKVVIETEDPFTYEEAEAQLWLIYVYCTLADGSVTRTVLGVRRPLRPGQFTVIRAKAKTDGSALPERESTVGVSITLGWTPGMHHEVVF